MRYFAQAYDIEASMKESNPGKTVTRDDLKDLFDNFHNRHEEMYGHADRAMMAGTTSLRLVASGGRPKLNIAEKPVSFADASIALKRSRSVYFKELGGFVNTRCYDGDKLQHGNTLEGPAIIEEKTTTVVVPPSAMINVDRWGNYIGKLQ